MSTQKNYHHLGRIIAGEKAENDVVVIHSLSKIRSIPGVRFGYILGQQDLVSFVKYFCEMHYGMNGLTYISSILIDLLYQTITICRHIPLKTIKKTFRHIIMNSFEQGVAKDILFGVIRAEDLSVKIEAYAGQLKEHNETMSENYKKITGFFKDNRNVGFTAMQASFNFLLVYKNPRGMTEGDYQGQIARQLNSIVFTQRNFCASDPRDDICMRLSCAALDDDYVAKMIKLNTLLSQ